LHEKYAKDDLVVISVSLDDPHEKDKKDKKERERKDTVLEFLQKQRAIFTNLILDEGQEFWQKKFGFTGPPCVFVFNREGKWKRFASDDPYAEVAKLVAEYLKK
jgi:hypothetical protein